MPHEAPSTADAAPEEGESEHRVDAARLGERLGRYKLVMPLAQGGMGLVFAGRLVGPHGVERLVAIKTLRPITSASDRAALLREAKLTSRLHHRNVVATLDLGEVDDVPYVVMELVDGIPLSRLMTELSKRNERLAPELAAWILMQAAHGLHAAHDLTDPEGRSLGLVHRDVSPQNILLSVQGEVKIADFGIAKYTGREESTTTGMLKGKFAYMSPEQAGSGVLDRRSDVFALGIVLWEAFTGERLFAAETPARTILRVHELTPRSPAEVRPEVGEELSAITMCCLAKSAADRFSSAAAVADALRAVLRTRSAHVDEGDLAAVVQRLFGEERAKTMDRIRTATPITEGTTETMAAPGEASGLVAVSLSNVRGESSLVVPLARTSRVVTALVVLGVVVAGGLAWSLTHRPDGGHAESTSSATTPMSGAAVASVAAPAALSADSEPAAASAASAKDRSPTSPSTATSVAATALAPPRMDKRRLSKPAAAPATAKPATPAPAKSRAGQPFESL